MDRLYENMFLRLSSSKYNIILNKNKRDKTTQSSVPLLHNNMTFLPPIFDEQIYILCRCRKRGTA